MNKIKAFRKEQSIKLSNLSQMTGLSTGYLSHLERGEKNNPSYNTMKKIAIALGKNIGDVFDN